uniref:CN hydrolase domain-containing protein n=2 Tax=Glossina morsitans morsitans TaxID=37546 RepID=A0A1B0GA13_GLOMM
MHYKFSLKDEMMLTVIMALKAEGVKVLLGFVLILCIGNSEEVSLPSDPTYNAGVVEFVPAKVGLPKDLVIDNLKRIKAIIESEATKDLDILVFPEYILNNMDMKTYIPDPKDGIVPCEVTNYDWFLTELSCAARSRQLYLVVNMLEKEFCLPFANQRKCHPSGYNTFNTNVVLDRQGRVISRYRKSHLFRYEWYSTDILETPQLATFTTDFGVTFGHFICFDMLYYEPAEQLVKEKNVTDIIYPTHWFSELPFLTAVQNQEGWAFANDVNLLAADASYPSQQNTGSGIYAGRLGRLSAAIFQEPTTKLLIAKVPKSEYRSSYQMPTAIEPVFMPQLVTPRFTKLDLQRDYNVDVFTTKLLEENFTTVNEMLCHRSFCCDFQIERQKIGDSPSHQAYRFRLAAYSGTETTFQRVSSSNQSLCAVIACTGSDLYTCGYIFPESVAVGNKYYFSKLQISGDFIKAKRSLIMPSTLNANIMPLKPNVDFTWQEVESSKTQRITLNLSRPQMDLLTFAIWSNYYSTVDNTHNLDPIVNLKQPIALTSSAVTPFSFKSFQIIFSIILIVSLKTQFN